MARVQPSKPLLVPHGYFRGDEVALGRRSHLERDELQRLFAALKPNPFWYGYYRVQWYYGCRVSEPALLFREDVDFRGKRIVIRHLKRRNATGFLEDEYPLPDGLVGDLRAVQAQVRRWGIPKENPWLFPSRREPVSGTAGDRLANLRRTVGGWRAVSRAAAHRAFVAAAREAKVPEHLAHSHVLRHTRATLLLADGASTEEVQILLGHDDVATTKGYLGVADSLRNRLGAVAKLGGGEIT